MLTKVNSLAGSASTSSQAGSIMMHHSRDTAHKQWAETQVLILTGVARCVCVSVLACMYVYASSSSVYVCVLVYMCVHLCLSMDVCMYVCMYVCVCVCVCVLLIYTCMSVCIVSMFVVRVYVSICSVSSGIFVVYLCVHLLQCLFTMFDCC